MNTLPSLMLMFLAIIHHSLHSASQGFSTQSRKHFPHLCASLSRNSPLINSTNALASAFEIAEEMTKKNPRTYAPIQFAKESVDVIHLSVQSLVTLYDMAQQNP